jgi:hypothetical protein
MVMFCGCTSTAPPTLPVTTGLVPPGTPSTPAGNPSMATVANITSEDRTSYFSARQIELMRETAQKGSITLDPGLFREMNASVINYPGSLNDVLIPYRHLKIREGYKIEGCGIYYSLGASVYPFIVNNTTALNNPQKINELCTASQLNLSAESDESIMAYISGDDSPESYIEASIFLRELKAIGAWWHGRLGWPMQVVIDSPENPKVLMNSTHAIVVFSTEESYCGYDTITQYTDVFVRKNYQYSSDQIIIQKNRSEDSENGIIFACY